tara:strand:- start:69 stop:212 length:144 start_codon:yes stop_codon:yes gene_type:complete
MGFRGERKILLFLVPVEHHQHSIIAMDMDRGGGIEVTLLGSSKIGGD